MNNSQWMSWHIVPVMMLCAALGCQAQAPTNPRTAHTAAAKAKTPQVRVQYGELAMDPDVSMAIVVRLSDLNRAKYSLEAVPQAAVATTDPNAFSTISVTVTGGSPKKTYPKTVDVSQFIDGTASFVFSSLPPGNYDVHVDATNAAGTVIRTADGKAVIQAGMATRIDLNCQPTMGSLTVNFNCGSSTCGVSPAPTPVPTATPTPPPANLLNVTDIDKALGFAVDKLSNIYIFTREPDNAVSGGNPGAIRKVDGATLTLTNTRLDDNEYLADTEGEIFDNAAGESILTTRGNASIKRINLVTGGMTEEPASAGYGFFTGVALIQPQADGRAVFGMGTVNQLYGMAWIKQQPGDSTTVYQYIPSAGEPRFCPISMAYDRVHMRAVWGSVDGLNTWTHSGTPYERPIRLIDENEGVYGFAPIDDEVSQVLYSTNSGGNTPHAKKVMYSDLHTAVSPNPAPVSEAWSSLYGYPRRVEKGADGYYYVMLSETADTAVDSVPGFRNYRIVKFTFNPVSHLLVPVQTVVNAMIGTAPSY